MSQDSAKYDRQLRMWGEEAQRLLEHSHVCVIGASVVGAETLKCIVLPGVGAYTLIDAGRVTAEDCGTNFFVRGLRDIGRPRAQAVSEAISELNPGVKAHYLDVMPDEDSFWSQFSVVVAAQTTADCTVTLSSRLRRLCVPLLIVKSHGMVGSLRVDAPDHMVLDVRADFSNPDLRISEPFPELVELAESAEYADINSMDSEAHSHVPYVVLLVRVLREWQRLHPAATKQLPRTEEEQKEFMDLLNALKRSDDETNFAEAQTFAFLAWSDTSLPDDLKRIFDDPRCVSPSAEMSDVWLVASALKQFVENEGRGMLPLQGSVPDMTAHTDQYVALQRVYHDRAEADIAAVSRRVEAIRVKLGRSYPVPDSLVRQMCKNAASLMLLTYPPVHTAPSNVPVSGAASDLEQTGDYTCAFSWMLVMEAAEAFAKEHGGRWPGDHPPIATREENLSSDAQELKAIVTKMLIERKYPEDAIKPEVITEMFVVQSLCMVLFYHMFVCLFV